MPSPFVAFPPRVLVCDDSESICHLASMLLKRSGCSVECVNSGEDALTLLEKQSFDLLLLDVVLPGISGLEVAKKIRDRLGNSGFLPIILLTSNVDVELRREGLEAGATDFVSKPFDPVELIARIKNHSSIKRLHDSLAKANDALEAERDKVAAIQRHLLPKEFPEIPNVEFTAGYLPSSKVGGDYYDVILRPDGKVSIIIADVSGHGIPSSIYMSMVRAALHAHERKNHDLATIYRGVDDILKNGLDDFSFVTLYMAHFDPETYVMEQLMAGHHLPLLLKKNDGEIEEIPQESNFPMGLMVLEGDMPLEIPTSKFQLARGQRLILFTDGIIEEFNPEMEQFGMERFQQLLKSTAYSSLDESRDLIFETVRSFAGIEEGFNDDVTLLMMDIL